ncbi:MAG: ATP-dependent helicase C-terminal domain-containing protein [Vicinamibacterales bacterium]
MLASLPIDAALDDIRAAIDRAAALVVVAAPGAGKTTRVPPALLHRGPLICLQPRRAAARAIARRIADERGWTLGKEVGWHVRFEPRFSHDTRLLVATEGMLTARLQQDPFLSEFATIVLDEFHERSVHTDLALALARQALRARDDLRLVVMSATMAAASVAAFLDDCPIVEVPGRGYPVHVEYRPHQSPASAVSSMLAATQGNILCFEPGAREIGTTVDTLRALADVDVLPLHGSLTASDQDAAIAEGARRRVIVCTNIAETSLTVPRVTGVVDSGLEKVARYDAEFAIDSLSTESISRAAADQRAGRAGRVAPGVVYRLWERADKLKAFREPEIRRVDLAGVALDILGWGGDPTRFEWFEQPDAEALDSALTLLHRLGALDAGALTPLGKRLLRTPLPPRLARIVADADGHRDAVRAAILLAEPRAVPRTSTPASTTSDVLTALDRWSDVPEHLRSLATQVERNARDSGDTGRTLSESQLRHAVFAGFPDRVAQRRAPQSPRCLLASGTGAVQTADSGVRDASLIVGLDVQASSNPGEPESRIRKASAVDREWLVPTRTVVEHTLDGRGVVRARRVEYYDALRLSEQPAHVDSNQAAALLAAEWLRRPMSEADQLLVRRLRFAGVTHELESLVRTAASTAHSLATIDIASALSPAARTQLATGAPETLRVPSGRLIPLDYAEDGTVSASVKLQELFGLADTPVIGLRREPVLLLLLAPNGRPVQTTRDLRSFWTRTYPEVRKELRGRYPRHPWPEDPWTATPTHRAKPRG